MWPAPFETCRWAELRTAGRHAPGGMSGVSVHASNQEVAIGIPSLPLLTAYVSVLAASCTVTSPHACASRFLLTPPASILLSLRPLQIYYVDPPTIDLASIRQPTLIWQGGQDATTPPAMARHYASVIPGAQLHLLENEAHLSLPYRHNNAILGSLVEALAGAAGAADTAGNGAASGSAAAGGTSAKANL